jgi:hypothetical protein
MTEAEWLNADHPYKLIYHASCRNDCKRRLFACACARRALVFLSDSRFVNVVDGCEQFADSVIAWKDVLALRKSLRKARTDLETAGGLEHQHHAAVAIGAVAAKEFMLFKMAVEAAAAAAASKARPHWDRGRDRETAAQLAIARDIFGNPFRPVAFDPASRTDTAVSLARGIYESHADPLPRHDRDTRPRVLGGRSGAGESVTLR